MIRITFHGTSHLIKEFNESSIGKGGDPNSALGVHSTDEPAYACEYAELSCALDSNSSESIILVLSYESTGSESTHDYDEFYGCHEDETNTKEHFSEKREDLLDNDIDIFEFEGGENNITTLLAPEKIKIIDKLSVGEATKLSEFLFENNIQWDNPTEILKAIDIIKATS